MSSNFSRLLLKRTWLLKSYIKLLSSILGSLAKEIRLKNNDIEIKTTPNNLRSLILFLKNHSLTQYKQLIEIACSDNPGKQWRFSLVYVLNSVLYSTRLLVTIKTNEVNPIPSVIEIFSSAGWLEREVYDLYGVFFYDHPDLRRILTDYGFNGHPLRKDFPLSGFVELYYNDTTKRISYETVELSQEFRTFSLTNSWTTAT